SQHSWQLKWRYDKCRVPQGVSDASGHWLSTSPPFLSTMTTGKLLDEAIEIARRQGYELRHEHLGGTGTGYYQLRDKLWLVLDVAQPDDEQLAEVARAIKAQPLPADMPLSDALAEYLEKN